MQGSDLIYVVLPVVILLALFVFITLPSAAARSSGDRRSGGRHSRQQQFQGQMPGHPAAPDAFGSDVVGLDHGQPSVTAHAHVPSVETSVETIVSGGTAGNRTPAGSPSS